MENADKIEVEVCYALPAEQTVLKVKIDAGQTAGDAIALSGILNQHPEIDLAVNKVGVFGKLVRLDAPLQPGDRVEIYRPLIADPKESRRKKAEVDKKALTDTPDPASPL
jgi:uncharacterized protein